MIYHFFHMAFMKRDNDDIVCTSLLPNNERFTTTNKHVGYSEMISFYSPLIRYNVNLHFKLNRWQTMPAKKRFRLKSCTCWLGALNRGSSTAVDVFLQLKQMGIEVKWSFFSLCLLWLLCEGPAVQH